MFYDAGLSASVSFEPEATADADRFARERVGPRLRGGPDPVDAPIAVVATDGELYGHHQQFRDLFLQRLVAPEPATSERGFDVVTVAKLIADSQNEPRPAARIVERTSWSCHHGVARWSAECPDAPDGRWKGPLRAAFERLAGAVDTVFWEHLTRVGDIDPMEARNDYVDVVIGRQPAATFASERWPTASDEDRRRVLDLLEAERWRLAMFASDGWYWDDPIRPETRQVVRAAARAARLVDAVAGTDLERRHVADLAQLTSPSRGLDGAAIYRIALEDVGQRPITA